jgi:hypothetical protein
MTTMAKTLKDFLNERQLGPMVVKNPDEQKFIDKHVVAKTADRNGNDDELFKGSKVKMADRKKDRKGYNPGEDEEVYEALKGAQHKIDANKNGKVDAHDFHLLRKKKKVVEEAEQVEEKLDMKKASMGTVVKDFQKSDAPQFMGKSQKKRQAMAVAAKLTAERGKQPMNKEERLLTKLADISETHQRTMVSVFEKLNEDNQYAFMQACDTADGIEQMLDFSISYRGE